MEKTDKPLTREALVSMQVIDAKGRFVGKVKDVAFEIGKSGVLLSVEKDDEELQHISWDEVQAASDFIILKSQPQVINQAQPQQSQTQSTQTLCPTCNQPLTWIPQYQRWYCYNEKKYV